MNFLKKGSSNVFYGITPFTEHRGDNENYFPPTASSGIRTERRNQYASSITALKSAKGISAKRTAQTFFQLY